jgi:hypothetical protein
VIWNDGLSYGFGSGGWLVFGGVPKEPGDHRWSRHSCLLQHP